MPHGSHPVHPLPLPYPRAALARSTLHNPPTHKAMRPRDPWPRPPGAITCRPCLGVGPAAPVARTNPCLSKPKSSLRAEPAPMCVRPSARLSFGNGGPEHHPHRSPPPPPPSPPLSLGPATPAPPAPLPLKMVSKAVAVLLVLAAAAPLVAGERPLLPLASPGLGPLLNPCRAQTPQTVHPMLPTPLPITPSLPLACASAAACAPGAKLHAPPPRAQPAPPPHLLPLPRPRCAHRRPPLAAAGPRPADQRRRPLRLWQPHC
jgi:hypothetical protein